MRAAKIRGRKNIAAGKFHARYGHARAGARNQPHMKYLIASILALTLTFALGACASHESASMNTSTSATHSTTGYSK
jgi:hypothetical protein